MKPRFQTRGFDVGADAVQAHQTGGRVSYREFQEVSSQGASLDFAAQCGHFGRSGPQDGEQLRRKLHPERPMFVCSHRSSSVFQP